MTDESNAITDLLTHSLMSLDFLSHKQIMWRIDDLWIKKELPSYLKFVRITTKMEYNCHIITAEK